MILSLLACTGPEGPSNPPTTVDTDRRGIDRPVLASPPEAPDLDPAEDVVRVALTAAPLLFDVGGITVDGWGGIL